MKRFQTDRVYLLSICWHGKLPAEKATAVRASTCQSRHQGQKWFTLPDTLTDVRGSWAGSGLQGSSRKEPRREAKWSGLKKRDLLYIYQSVHRCESADHRLMTSGFDQLTYSIWWWELALTLWQTELKFSFICFPAQAVFARGISAVWQNYICVGRYWVTHW